MTEKKTINTLEIRALGRRKTAAARARMVPGKGIIVVNKKPLNEYFPHELLQQKVMEALVATGKEKSFDISIRVLGGGPAGQAEAVRHAIARGLVKYDEVLRAVVKAEGLLTRDPREKERKKFGRRRARRGHQWRKR
ncbi:MAG: 30S ribosomal protein S9 [Candidatus Magasanikbacteria bacterium]